ncbi:MAG: AAA family ATPase [Rhodospirillaceae bacterium]|nr:AAA family ATPase [Rhodospirillaceae bacterium]
MPMKLARVHVTDFQSVRNSGIFEIGDITCLVGKNESGKTALLQALYRLNPFVAADGRYSVTDDFPRAAVEDYRIDVEDGRRPPALVARAEFALDPEEIAAVEAAAGPGALGRPILAVAKGYDNLLRFECAIDEAAALRHTIAQHQPLGIAEPLDQVATLADAIELLGRAEPTDAVRRLAALLREVQFRRGFGPFIAESVLEPRLPKFLYFDEYYRLQGRANIEALKARLAEGRLEHSDYPLLGLINRARLKIDDLLDPARTRDLKNRLEGAGNHLTRQVVKYWSQNRHLQLRFDVRPAQRDDPEGMRDGTNLWSEVYDSKHMVTTELGTRSRGFVWFFSFLAWYGDVQRENRNVILLLDEPGVSLHAKAQADLLRYFEAEVKDHHQLLYSTHSPFMIEPARFDRVRIVQDLGIEADAAADASEGGTRVIADLTTASADSLSPLQAVLGTELAKGLFAAPHVLAVEGIAELLFLETMSALLAERGRPGLAKPWSVTPVGGAERLAVFLALASTGQGGATQNLAVLMALPPGEAHAAEASVKKALFARNRILTYADFAHGREAGIEDMFEPETYLRLVNEEYRLGDQYPPLHILSLPSGGGIVRRVEAHCARFPLPGGHVFRRERPARYLMENLSALGTAVSPAVLARFETLFEQLNRML